jgi:epoxyqueuosine reductase
MPALVRSQRPIRNGCDVCQTVCPYDVKFARALPDDSRVAARAALASKDARQLAREILGLGVDAYRAAFRGSPCCRSAARDCVKS